MHTSHGRLPPAYHQIMQLLSCMAVEKRLVLELVIIFGFFLSQLTPYPVEWLSPAMIPFCRCDAICLSRPTIATSSCSGCSRYYLVPADAVWPQSLMHVSSPTCSIELNHLPSSPPSYVPYTGLGLLDELRMSAPGVWAEAVKLVT